MPKADKNTIEKPDDVGDESVIKETSTDFADSLARQPISVFDEMIDQVRAALPNDVRQVEAPSASDLPFAHGPRCGGGVVLKSRCAVELGGAIEGACAMTLSTSDVARVRDGVVTVAGPDVCDFSGGEVVPFAQIILVAGHRLQGSCHQAIEECQTVKDWVEGYMVRSVPGAVYARVSTALHEKGLTFAQLGSALAEMVRATNEAVEAVEVIFVTSSKDDVEKLCELRGAWTEASHSLRRDSWLERGVDIDCPSGGHCGNCADKEVCDRIRDIERLRKRVKEEVDS